MKKQTERVKPEAEKYVMKGDIKVDNRGRDEIFEVTKDGVTLDLTANFTEASSVQKQSIGSRLYSINMQTGKKTLRVSA